MSEMIEIGGLWKNKSKAGVVYLTGYMGKARVLIFPNGYKKSDNHPDYIMYIAPSVKNGDNGDDAGEVDDVEF